MSQPSESEAKEEDLSWLMPETTEPHGNRFFRKAKENPFVPIGQPLFFTVDSSFLLATSPGHFCVCLCLDHSHAGCLATVGALSFGLVQFKRGNMARSQLAMRLRVLAQGGTVIALIAGVLVSSMKSSKKT